MGNAVEPELITIVEGPTPQFTTTPDLWPLSIREDPQPFMAVLCQMRTFDGPKMVERCRRAWSEDRMVKLDFPDESGLRQQVAVIAVRWTEVEEGHLLHLWVQLPQHAEEDSED